MKYKTAAFEDFDIAFSYIEQLWTYNTYVREDVLKVYKEILEDPDSFAFFLIDDDEYVGFCHGCYFNTSWIPDFPAPLHISSMKNMVLKKVVTDSN